jgi:Ankyrin repeats (many copies)
MLAILHCTMPAFSDAEMIQSLLDLDASVNAKNSHGCTPLYLASHYSKVDNACKLLDNGADLLECNINGRTPLDVAEFKHVKNAIIAYHCGMMRQLRQEVNDLKKKPAETKNAKIHKTMQQVVLVLFFAWAVQCMLTSWRQ